MPRPVSRGGQTWDDRGKRIRRKRRRRRRSTILTSIAEPAAGISSLAPFRVRSFRFQWPADLATSWAFEMETLILGWYVLVETGSVLWLTLFASLQYLGTLVAPMTGVIGNRVGYRTVLCTLRIVYAAQAATLMVLAYADLLDPVYVFAVATVMGVFRPSDLVMRYALVGQTIPSGQLTGAMSVSRTTVDSARVAGALAGAGMVAALGMGPAYTAITALYAVSFLLTLGVARDRPGGDDAGAGGSGGVAAARASPWHDLGAVFVYVWRTPHLLAAMCLAFLVNLTAFPMSAGLLPYVAKDIYGTGQTGLGWLAAGFAFGALIGSLVLTRFGNRARPGRMMIVFCAVWYALLLVFAQLDAPSVGIPVLMLAGCAQSLGLVPMSAMLVRVADPRYRGGVLGLRMLAVYGLPLGLLGAGPLIDNFGFAVMASGYALFGLAAIGFILARWRAEVWADASPANAR
jgi:predicted MFS family arabinose efflux permease